MKRLAIKIKISDRIYPMKVEAEDETFVRRASKMLTERIKDYQKNFSIQDQQDLLAMVAFDCLVAYLKLAKADGEKMDEVMKKIKNWSDCIEQTLS